MSTVTRMPEVIDALLTIIEEATKLQVTDGPHLGELMDAAVVVGLTDGPETPGYRTDLEPLDGSGRRARYRESWTVHCLLTLVSGDTAMASLRAEAGGHLAAILEALRYQPADGARPPWDTIPRIARTQWAPIQDQNGAAVNVVFDVVGTCLL